MAGRALQITYVGDAKSVLAAQGQIDAGHSKLQGTTSKTGGLFQNTFGNIMPLAAAAAGVAVVKFAVDTVKAASDEAESLNKAKVVFEGASDSVIRFSDNSAKSFGISKAAALEAAGGFGAMLQTAGLAEDASADMSVAMVKLAGDMASFNNQDPSEMLERLRSGLAGEAEPLRKFGVFLSEARVQTEAVNLGLAEQGEKLTEAQKVQARYSLILQDTNKQQGDFGRTLGESLPNQIRVARAAFTDLQADLGRALLPALTELLTIGSELVQDLGPALEFVFSEVGEGASFFAESLNEVKGPLQDLLSLIPDVGKAGEEGGESMGILERGFRGVVDVIVPGSKAALEFKDRMDELTDSTGKTTEAAFALDQTYGVFQRGINAATGAVEDSTGSLKDLKTAHDEAADAARDQRLAILALSDDFLGIVDSANQVSEAQAELNRLERKGREDTKAYEQAVLDALEAQIGLEDAVLSYGKELAESGEKQRDVIAKVKDLASQFGIEKDVVHDLVAEIRAHIRGLEDIPSNITTTITTIHRWEGLPKRGAQFGLHGTLSEDTMILAHAGERVDISPRGRSRGGSSGPTIYLSVGTVVGPGGIREVVDILRRELLEVGRANTDIFAGRA